MRICLINNLYKPYNRGGAERIVEMLASGLKKAGHDIVIITTKPIFKEKPQPNTHNPIPTTYYLNSLYYSLSKIPKIIRIFWHIYDMFNIYNYFKIKSILKKEKPNIVLTNNLKGIGFLIPRVIKKLNIRHIHNLHDIQLIHPSGLIIYNKEILVNNFLIKIYTKICSWLVASPDIVISPSKWLMKFHTNKKFFSKSKKIILPNPIINIQDINQTKKILLETKPIKNFRFLYAGQIEKHKGVLFLIKTFTKLCNNSLEQKCELIIMGNGSKIKAAKKLATGNNNIKFKAWPGEDKAREEMLDSDCILVPSLCYENSPLVIYKAAEAGRPVIASRLGGITELVRKIGGILFKPKNEGDLMYQIKWAINNKNQLTKTGQKMKKNIKQYILSNYIKKIAKLF